MAGKERASALCPTRSVLTGNTVRRCMCTDHMWFPVSAALSETVYLINNVADWVSKGQSGEKRRGKMSSQHVKV